jgi:hypothetical protein
MHCVPVNQNSIRIRNNRFTVFNGVGQHLKREEGALCCSLQKREREEARRGEGGHCSFYQCKNEGLGKGIADSTKCKYRGGWGEGPGIEA